MIDRDGVRDAARYLRSVRPVDPEEIHEYVEGRPHPAVVRRVLREEAYDLGLLERADGTFVPVDDDPVPAVEWSPDALPDRHAHALRDLLVERLGTSWASGESGDRLRARLRELKERYHRHHDVEYDERTALAYAVYHLPGYWAAAGAVLARLARAGRLPRRLRVLDVGAGVGGPALALFDLLPDDAVVDYHAVEPSAAADAFESLVDPPRGSRTTLHRTRVEAFDDEGPFDLVLCANVLSELDDPTGVARDLFDRLADDGTFVGVAPAERVTATGLRTVERALADDGPGTVFDPTLRLWPDAAPADDCWSFDVGPTLDRVGVQSDLDALGSGGPGDGTFRNEAVRYAYALVRRDGRRRVDVRASAERHARFAESERHVTKRVDALAVKLSHDLTGDDGANPLFLVGDGSQRVDHYAVLARESSLNRALRTAPYGAVVGLENALVLWNDDEGAYNLVVDGESVVDRVA